MLTTSGGAYEENRKVSFSGCRSPSDQVHRNTWQVTVITDFKSSVTSFGHGSHLRYKCVQAPNPAPACVNGTFKLLIAETSVLAFWIYNQHSYLCAAFQRTYNVIDKLVLSWAVSIKPADCLAFSSFPKDSSKIKFRM